MVIEVAVHSSLRDFLRETSASKWPHHLTMARLVARALRLGRPALLQTGSSVKKYCLSYLMPALMGDWSVIIVTPIARQQYLIETVIPQLQEWLGTTKQIRSSPKWQEEINLLLTTPESWLSDRLYQEGRFPANIPTIIDGADDLEAWARQQLTISLEGSDWDRLLQATPEYADLIRDTRVKLTKAVFAHPPNPYKCYLLDESEKAILKDLCDKLALNQELSPKFAEFWQHLSLTSEAEIFWTSRQSATGSFTIHLAPIEIAETLSPIWQQQPLVLIGSFLADDSDDTIYRQKLGLPEILFVKFSPNRQYEHIRLYLPSRLPLPNTPEFRDAVLEQVRILVGFSAKQPVVILVDDVPLRGQIGLSLAGQFGSRVKIDETELASDGILVTGWRFWQQHQNQLPTPQLLIITTLPLPSLENPLVASRVAYYKRLRKDWFRLYLLPTALNMLQQAIVPLRESQGIVALLDHRVNCRSYGKTILSVLEPCARINYIDPNWFGLL
ncbi:MAG TPA: helicase C-terminal domain-containing protein [Xenococcaceae cyanobacterium]